MNYSTAVFLINDKVRAIACSYDQQPLPPGVKPPVTIFKSFDTTLKAGDYVVIPTGTRHGKTVVKVEEVDVEFDIETNTQMAWIISKVDETAYEQTLAQEQEAIKVIQSAEKTKKRTALRDAVLADSEAKLAVLSISAIGHTSE